MVAYSSHTLSISERKWSTYDRELSAVVWAVRHFKHFLSGISFTVITDHKPLLSLRKSPVDNDPTGRRNRWILELDMYDYSISHREGKQYANADAMSRRPITETVKLFSASSSLKVPVKQCPTLAGPGMTLPHQSFLTSALHCLLT